VLKTANTDKKCIKKGKTKRYWKLHLHHKVAAFKHTVHNLMSTQRH